MEAIDFFFFLLLSPPLQNPERPLPFHRPNMGSIIDVFAFRTRDTFPRPFPTPFVCTLFPTRPRNLWLHLKLHNKIA